MAFKLDRYHSDYLFWIVPLIILGLLVLAIKRDNNRESATSSNAGFKADSSITMGIKDRMVDSHTITNFNDSTLIYYTTTQDD